MRFSNATYGQPEIKPNFYRQKSLASQFQPSSGGVVSAYIEEVFKGVGSLYADLSANLVTEAEKQGTPLTQEEYVNSDYFRDQLPYYDTMTKESAEILADDIDETNIRALYINNATGVQNVLGFGTSFAAGIFEPKNLAIGVATAGLLGPLVNQAVGVTRMAKIYQKYGKIKSQAIKGGVEGMVAATLAEPSNRDSARILRKDYSMLDSLFNIGLSTTLGAGINVFPTIVRSKLANRKFAQQEMMEELDTAVAQISEGRQVKVDAIEKIRDGNIRSKNISEQLRFAEKSIKYTDSSVFKAAFRGSKLKNKEGKPVPFYTSKGEYADQFAITTDKTQANLYNTDPKKVSNIVRGKGKQQNLETKGIEKGENVEPYYINSKDPFYTDKDIRKNKEILDVAKAKGHDSVIDSQGNLAVFDAVNEVSPFGKSKLDDIVEKLDTDNLSFIKNSIVENADQANSTAYEQSSINEFNSYVDEFPDEQLDSQLNEIKREVDLLQEQGLLDAEDQKALQQLEDSNLESMNNGLDAAYICLTKG